MGAAPPLSRGTASTAGRSDQPAPRQPTVISQVPQDRPSPAVTEKKQLPTASETLSQTATSGLADPVALARPKDLPSDLIYLTTFARAGRLGELKGKFLRDNLTRKISESKFVTTGADSCEITEKKPEAPGNPIGIYCIFPISRFSYSDLRAAAKSAQPGLTWSEVEIGLGTVEGNDSSIWMHVTRYRETENRVDIVIYQHKL
jgi:hypothetical protein